MPNIHPANTTTQEVITTTENTTLRSAVINRITQTFRLMGADAAMAEFNQMTVFFSGCRDWPDINSEVMDFFLEMKQQSDQKAQEQASKRDASLLQALAAHGLNGQQVNLMFGQSPQAPYYGTPNNGGEEH